MLLSVQNGKSTQEGYEQYAPQLCEKLVSCRNTLYSVHDVPLYLLMNDSTFEV
jgi:hypothetical protein